MSTEFDARKVRADTLQSVAASLKSVAAVARRFGVTRKEAEVRAGVSSTAVGDWQNGKHPPTITNLAAYVSALGGRMDLSIYHPGEEHDGTYPVVTDRQGARILGAVDGLSEADKETVYTIAVSLERMGPQLRELLRQATEIASQSRGDTGSRVE